MRTASPSFEPIYDSGQLIGYLWASSQGLIAYLPDGYSPPPGTKMQKTHKRIDDRAAAIAWLKRKREV